MTEPLSEPLSEHEEIMKRAEDIAAVYDRPLAEVVAALHDQVFGVLESLVWIKRAPWYLRFAPAKWRQRWTRRQFRKSLYRRVDQ